MKRFSWLGYLATICGVTAACSSPNAGPSTDQFRLACAWSISCTQNGLFGGVVAGSTCVHEQQQLFAIGEPFPSEVNRRYACAQSASTCDAYGNCTSRNHGPSYCSANPNKSCDGNLLIDCGGNRSGWANTVDCASFNLTCRTANGSASCSDGTTCDPSASETCTGNVANSCDHDTHLVAAADCSVILPTSQCGVVSGRVRCTLPGPMCQQSTPRCSGNNLIVCDSNTSRENTIDCAHVYQGSCRIVGSTAQCVADATDCANDAPDQCMGNNMQICVNGRWTSTDCTTLGFRTCGMVSGGFLGRSHIACTN